MAATMVSSAGGLLAMLNETHPLLKLHALSNLNNLVDNFWPEISTSVPVMYFLSPLSVSVSVSYCKAVSFSFHDGIWVLVVRDLFVLRETEGKVTEDWGLGFEIGNAGFGV